MKEWKSFKVCVIDRVRCTIKTVEIEISQDMEEVRVYDSDVYTMIF